MDPQYKISNDHYERGDQFFNAKQYQLAIPHFLNAVKTTPHWDLDSRVSKIARIVYCYAHLGDEPSTTKHVNWMLQEEQKYYKQVNGNANETAGRAYMVLTRYDLAYEQYNEASKYHGNQKDRDYAKQKWDAQRKEQEVRSNEILEQTRRAYVANDLDDVIKKANEAVQIYNENSMAYEFLGSAFLAKKDYALAIKNYKLCLKLNPNNENAQNYLKEAQCHNEEFLKEQARLQQLPEKIANASIDGILRGACNDHQSVIGLCPDGKLDKKDHAKLVSLISAQFDIVYPLSRRKENFTQKIEVLVIYQLSRDLQPLFKTPIKKKIVKLNKSSKTKKNIPSLQQTIKSALETNTSNVASQPKVKTENPSIEKQSSEPIRIIANVENFFEALKDNDYQTAENMFKKEPALLRKEKNKRTPLTQAAEDGNIAAMQWLKDHGVFVHETDSDWGGSAIVYAVSNGQLDASKWLEQNGAYLQDKDKNGTTLLMAALYHKKFNVAEWLISRRPSLLKDESKYQHTPMTCAAALGRNDSIDWLKSQGCSIHEKNSSNSTPIQNAVHRSHLETIKILVQYGASLSGTDGQNTLLIVALNNKNFEIADYLYKQRPSLLTEPDVNGYSPMTWAAFLGKTEAMEWLVDRGIGIKECDSKGRTPLAVAQAQKQNGSLSWLQSEATGEPHRAREERRRKVKEQEEIQKRRELEEARLNEEQRRFEMQQAKVQQKNNALAAEISNAARIRAQVKLPPQAEKPKKTDLQPLQQNNLSAQSNKIERRYPSKKGDEEESNLESNEKYFDRRLKELKALEEASSMELSKLVGEYNKLENQAIRLKSPDFFFQRAKFYFKNAESIKSAAGKKRSYENAWQDYQQVLEFNPFAEVDEQLQEIEIRLQNLTQATPSVSQKSPQSAEVTLKRENLTPEQQKKLDEIKMKMRNQQK